MREALEAVIEELRRMQGEGLRRVYLSDDTLLRLRDAATPARQPEPAAPPPSTAPTRPSPQAAAQAAQPVAASPTPQTPPVAPERRKVAAAPTPAGITPIPKPPAFELPPGDKATQWAWLRDRVLGCPVCSQHVRKGKKVVFGVGSLDAEIFFCGEAPGADEEIQGEPFVGAAGQLLTKIIQAMGLGREQVYIGNIMNWRPEIDFGNRPPTEEEMAFCLPYLKAQLAIVKPKVIVALGNTAVTGLLGPDPKRSMGKIRGQWFDFMGTPLMPTYHPSYLLHNQSNAHKRLVWEDMLKVMERVGLPVSEKQRRYFQT